MKVKYSVFRSLLKHSPEFEKEITTFLSELSSLVGTPLIEANVDDYDCDLKLLFVQSGGSEGLFLGSLEALQEPYYLLTNGGNNSLAASLEILTWVRQHNSEGEILHGDTKYIADRIISLAQASALRKRLGSTRLGVIGTPSDWLISSIPDEASLTEKLGIKLIHIPLSEVEAGIDTSSTLSDPASELAKANAVFDNIKHIVESEKLDGLTIRCFDLLTSIKMTGCLALARLNDLGITATCEGDIAAMISMHIVRAAFGMPSFQANPSRIDTEANEIVFAHCTVPYSMLTSHEHMTHFESGIGLAIRGRMQEAPVTVFRLASSLDEFTVYEGYITENLTEPDLCRTQIRVKLKDDVTSLLKKPCGNHHIIFYGHHGEELKTLLDSVIK